jgi:hypothetical protein
VGWRGYKDFAPTELGRESFVARGIITHALAFGGGTVWRRLRFTFESSRHAIKGAAANNAVWTEGAV